MTTSLFSDGESMSSYQFAKLANVLQTYQRFSRQFSEKAANLLVQNNTLIR